MNLFIAIHPPTATAQERKVKVINGKPVFYDPPAVKSAKELLSAYLAQHRPPEPMKGGLTKPDTDNLQKLLKDCMTRVGFWEDDAQVAREVIEKRWSDEPCGIYIEIEPLTEVST